MNSDKILNDVTQINKERIIFYEKAIGEIRSRDKYLRILFSEIIDESRKSLMSLLAALGKPAGAIEEEFAHADKRSGRWPGIKKIFIRHRRDDILLRSKYLEETMHITYENSLKRGYLPQQIRDLLIHQKRIQGLSYENIRFLAGTKALSRSYTPVWYPLSLAHAR
jgi:hypothetical protein